MNSCNPRDQEDRDAILEENNNCIVLASAGSGKTTILTEKLIKEAQQETEHYSYAAITFTNKAAKDINDRLIKSSINNTFVSTIDGFVSSEIIKNFAHIAFPSLKGFQQSYQRIHKKENYNDLVTQLLEEKILGVYTSNLQKNGRNFKYEFALNILKELQIAQEYIMYKYKIIFVDEYQDCDRSMHELFQYFKNVLDIKLFLVGDAKQSIYQWRGASPEYLIGLYESEEYKSYNLVENFRSEKSIVDFSLAISRDVVIRDLPEKKGLLYMNPSDSLTHSGIIDRLIKEKYIDLNEEILVLVGTNQDIENLYSNLNDEYKNQFSYIKRNEIVNCQNRYVLEEIAKYHFNNNYSEFDFLENLRFDYDKKYARDTYNFLERISMDPRENYIEEMFDFLDIPLDIYNGSSEAKILVDVLSDPLNSTIYTLQENRKMIMTTHSSKGLEADTVIIFTQYYFGHYNNALQIETNYVGITRARKKLILVDNGSNIYFNEMNSLLEQNNGKGLNFEHFVNIIP